MAKPKKLKVFRTPIGFHDAYVAAPSQKAALEAWGTDTNLFANGTAEVVTDEPLMKAALERPGEVIKVLRGSADEFDASVEQRNRPSPRPSPAGGRGRRPPRPPKPSRAEVEAAEKALAKLEKQQKAEMEAISREEEALERRRRSTERRHEAEHDEAAAERDRVQAQYERAVRQWEKSR